MKNIPKATLLSHMNKFLEDTPLPKEFWVFAYGSLLWHPEMTVAETRPATVQGFCRGFNLLSTQYRGTNEHPGLVLSLRPGDYCQGLALRIKNDNIMEDFTNLWLREMVTMFYSPQWLTASTPSGDVNVIAFVADQHNAQYVDYDVKITAAMISTAKGGRGANIDYFYNTLNMLKELNIDDPLLDNIARCLPCQNHAANHAVDVR